MSPSLAIVSANGPTSRPESVAERIHALQAEAGRLAADHAIALHASLVSTHAMAAEIMAGGEAYPPGVRAIARDILLTCERQGQTLRAINGRAL